jgi:hypothetical protein
VQNLVAIDRDVRQFCSQLGSAQVHYIEDPVYDR